MGIWEESEVTDRRYKKVSDTLELIQDDWPRKPKGVMLRTDYLGVINTQMILTEEDWKALRDFAIADAELEQETDLCR